MNDACKDFMRVCVARIHGRKPSVSKSDVRKLWTTKLMATLHEESAGAIQNSFRRARADASRGRTSDDLLYEAMDATDFPKRRRAQ